MPKPEGSRFDTVRVEDGRTLNVDEFLALALEDRVRILLSGNTSFRHLGREVERAEALRWLRTTRRA